MHGITLTKAPEDWEILQQEDGYARVSLEGYYIIHPAALEVGVESALPIIRVVNEKDNSVVIPWTQGEITEEKEDFSGKFTIELIIPEGGLYRIDTGVETKSTTPNLTWVYRGDCVLHIGVGNLFIIAGQSNAAGYSRDYIEDAPHMCVHLFRNRRKWDIASHPMNESTDAGSPANEEMGIPGPSPYLSFAKNLYQYTGIPVGLIQTALGGSPISSWKPGTGDLYQNMLVRLNDTGKKYAGLLWYQGCSDTEPENARNYLTNFTEFVTGIRNELTYDIPIFTFQLNRQINGLHDEGWGMVREAQRRAVEELKGVYVLSTTNCSLCDGIHNTAQANVVLGEKLAKQYISVIKDTEIFAAPDLREALLLTKEELDTLKLEGLWLRLEYRNVKNCFLVFSANGAESGFTLSDSEGRIEIKTIRSTRQDKNMVYLEIERLPRGDTYLSFAWEADPVNHPLIDEVTCLPPLSFYQHKIKPCQRKNER
jgi:sialate O-acetylesterase